MLEGQRVTLEETQPQGETIEQQTQPVEQSEDTQQAKQIEETEQAPQPQLRCSGRTRAQVTPRPET